MLVSVEQAFVGRSEYKAEGGKETMKYKHILSEINLKK